ncbi:hypothetical protein CRENPOLYSF2_2280005 [Crenothrix polyspora]|jgi:hypothetical protein|uniref:Uncharacterized protein n=1 Tax=Crenothrix polyspora TaxID=360316 RepID=A0A1R4H5Q7_9GAMM|nr:hypothetical protein CRENPOLYSF2_2280005 [Crenothrix polyspora]
MSHIHIYSGFVGSFQNTILEAVLNATSPNSKIGLIDTRHQLAPKPLKTKAFKPLSCIKANFLLILSIVTVLFEPLPKTT